MIVKVEDWDGRQTNVVIQGKMEEVTDKMMIVADLCVTSPPYGVGKVLTSVPGDGKRRTSKRREETYDAVADTFTEKDYDRWLSLSIARSELLFWNVPAKQFDHSFGVQSRPVAGQVVWAKSNGTVPFDKRGVIYSHENIWIFGDHRRIIKPFNSVWHMPTQRLSKHPAPFPPELPAKAINHATKKGDLVFDPFCGSGTTAAVAKALGRRWLTCDVSEQYCAWADERIEKTKEMAW